MIEDSVIWTGAEALTALLVPIDSLHPHPRNPRRGNVAEIEKSLVRFGQVRPVLALADGTIIAGNHTWKAAKARGWTHIARVAHEFATEQDARDYLLADNRLPELGDYEREELVALLAEVEEQDRWDGTGYRADDLAQLRRLEEQDLEPPPAPQPVQPQPAAPAALRERVMLLGDDDHASFGAHVRTLRTEYGLEGVSEVVLRAVHEEALRLNQGGK